MSFKAQCPYCQNVVAASQEAMGNSARCPKCGDFFTIAPMDEEFPLPAHGPAAKARRRSITANDARSTSAVSEEEVVESEADVAEKPGSLQPAGVVALLCGGVALLAASFPAWRWLTIPLSLVGVAVGGCAVVWVRAHEAPGIIVSSLGAATSTLVLAVALLFPGLLGPGYSTPRAPASPPSVLQVIPLQLAAGSAPGATADGYIDASLAALQQGSVRVQVVEAVMNAATKKRSSAVTIRLRVHLLEDSKELISKGLAFSGASGEAATFTLKGAGGSSYVHKEIKTVVPDEKESRLSAFPVAVSDELIRFEPAPASTQDLRLDVPTANWGGNAVFRFLIPKSMIRNQP